MIGYSPSTRGFYLPTNPNAPGDLVLIEPEYHAELIAGQSTGKNIVPGVGGVPTLETPAPGPEPVPAVVDRFQFHEQLRAMGIYDAALAAVTAQGGRTLRGFESASFFGRDNPAFNQLADALGYTEAQKDDFFRAAALIRA